MGKMPLLVIEGATSTGKSEIAVLVSQLLRGEVVSADSMQVYRGMDIGTGKIRPEETRGIPHHMLNVCEPEEPFDASRYVAMAREIVPGILLRGSLPVLCGGTGFYIQALLRDVDFSQAAPNPEYREYLTDLAVREGDGALYGKLLETDPEYAASVHPHNRKRVIRALEYHHETGKKLSSKNREDREADSPYDALVFHLVSDRAVLYRRIEKRVDRMMEEGLTEEVRGLSLRGLSERDVSMQGLGYKELFPYLRGERSLEDTVSLLKRDTRHYAKRQLTWFRADKLASEVKREEYGDDPVRIAEMIAEAARGRYRKGEDGWTAY